GLKVSSMFVLMEDLSLLRDALFLGIDSYTQLRQEEVKIRALDNYEHRKEEVEAKRMDVIYIYICIDAANSYCVSSVRPVTINYANSTLEKAILEMNPHRWTKVSKFYPDFASHLYNVDGSKIKTEAEIGDVLPDIRYKKQSLAASDTSSHTCPSSPICTAHYQCLYQLEGRHKVVSGITLAVGSELSEPFLFKAAGNVDFLQEERGSRLSRETKYDLGYAFQAVKCTDVARLGKYDLNLRRLSSFLHTRKFTVGNVQSRFIFQEDYQVRREEGYTKLMSSRDCGIDASSGSSSRKSWEGTPSVLGSVLVEGRRMRDFGIDVAWQALLKVLNPLYETTASYSHLVANKITISHVPMSHPGIMLAAAHTQLTRSFENKTSFSGKST
ncbi:hypothetical protein Tco_0868545, partial [Tanacetum coccineum]